jgi:hypothetical protein
MTIEKHFYIDSSKFDFVSGASRWAANTVYAVGALVHQRTATTSGRFFLCVTAGTTGAAEPTWVITRGAKTTDNTAVWQEVTGRPAVNGSYLKAIAWADVLGIAVSIGAIIKNGAGTHYFICDTAGTAGSGSEPTWNTTAGATTVDNTITWRCIGAISLYTTPFAAPAMYISLALSAGWSVAGAVRFVSKNHNYSVSATSTLSSVDTTANPGYVLCVEGNNADPIITTTGAAESNLSNTNCIINCSSTTFEGIRFNCGSGAGTHTLQSNGAVARYIKCTLASASAWQLGHATNNSKQTFDRCTFLFDTTARILNWGGNPQIEMIACEFATSGAIPTTLMAAPPVGSLNVIGGDASNIAGNILSVTNVNTGQIVFDGLKINPSATLVSSTFGSNNRPDVKFLNMDSGTAYYREYTKGPLGVIQSETGIYKNGGASDETTPLSLLMSSVGSNEAPVRILPLYAPLMEFYNKAIGNELTAKIELTTDTALTNEDLFVEVYYRNSALAPTIAVVSSISDILGTPVNLTVSDATWAGTAKTYKYSVSIPFTPAMIGSVKVKVGLVKAETTIYLDPKIYLSGTGVELTSAQYRLCSCGFVMERFSSTVEALRNISAGTANIRKDTPQTIRGQVEIGSMEGGVLAPAAVTAYAEVVSSASIHVTAKGGARYEYFNIYRNGGLTPINPSPLTDGVDYYDTNLPEGIEYSYVVKATNTTGTTPSNTAKATIGIVPGEERSTQDVYGNLVLLSDAAADGSIISVGLNSIPQISSGYVISSQIIEYVTTDKFFVIPIMKGASVTVLAKTPAGKTIFRKSFTVTTAASKDISTY